jgi:cell division protein FtsN
MEQKQRFFIYDRKEMGVLLFLGVMVAVFAFTLGVHLGKRVGPHVVAQGLSDAESVPTVPDKIPNRQELTEQAKGAQQAADESLNQALHDEVARTGIKLDTPRQLALPEKPISKNAGATTGRPSAVEEAAPVAKAPDVAKSEPAKAQAAPAEKATYSATVPGEEKTRTETAEVDAVALHRTAPEGRYTLQIGSFPVLDEARDQSDSLEALGMKPYMRAANVRGKQWYRLYVGGFATKEAAEKMGTRYVSQHMIDAYIVSKRVDEKPSAE